MSPVTHIVQFSTGAGSAEVAFRVHEQAHPLDSVVLLTANTRVEDPDNWRYAIECVKQMPGVQWIVLTPGRTPMEVGRDERIVPNNRMATCSKLLKRQPLAKWMEEHYEPARSIVYLGFDWTEEHRMAAAEPLWAPWQVRAPLMEPPYLTKWQIIDAHRERGIEPCRLYLEGFSHANCGGGCVRGGQAQWELLLRTHPDRYAEWEADEEGIRAMLGRDVSILRDRRGGESKPLSLRTFRDRLTADASLFDASEWGSCGCFASDAEPGQAS